MSMYKPLALKSFFLPQFINRKTTRNFPRFLFCVKKYKFSQESIFFWVGSQNSLDGSSHFFGMSFSLSKCVIICLFVKHQRRGPWWSSVFSTKLHVLKLFYKNLFLKRANIFSRKFAKCV